MIDYLIGVDGGGTGTRVRLARADGTELAQGHAGPSALAHGIDNAWRAVTAAVHEVFANAGLAVPPWSAVAIGLGLSGVHNKDWAAAFIAAQPGYGAIVLDTDATTTLLGAHAGAPGVIVAIGTGSVGQAQLPDGSMREAGGWGFPAGDEASGGWIGLRAVNLVERVVDGRAPGSAFAAALIDACGGSRDAIQRWLGGANQTAYAQLAPIVVAHAASDPAAHAMLEAAGLEVASLARALDPDGQLPLALCGGLGAPLRAFLPPQLAARCGTPQGDAASGALRMIARHLQPNLQG
ncbi:BadF/BadG/BcrA/BcrD ATPase family protein [Massilia sp. DWR3-1-1]|uniref:BadF/BadG/BcrA/BcrD ATPase family protein n=1 Tax=Massilia sp. DWR3-1-1 TaxID=2804559 RepID=UPI003CFB231E